MSRGSTSWVETPTFDAICPKLGLTTVFDINRRAASKYRVTQAEVLKIKMANVRHLEFLKSLYLPFQLTF